MLNFETNGKFGRVRLTLPTTLSEITPEYLKAVTNGIIVGDNYSLIGVVYRESLASVILANSRKQKNITTAIVPIFVKAGKADDFYINNIKTGDKIIIAPSDIALGHHVVAPKNKISINNIIEFCDGDKDAYQRAIGISTVCYYLEFKLVPNCTIHGNYTKVDDDKFINPFVTYVEGQGAE